MPPSLVRQVWTQVEETQANLLLQLDDASLAKHLVGKLDTSDGQEAHLAHHYVNAKLSLIRDLAQSRLVGSY